MGRAFLFLWVFTMPLVLVKVVDGFVSACIFLFFLTYGFVGMELVAMQLLNPFGDGKIQIQLQSTKKTKHRHTAYSRVINWRMQNHRCQ
jgi:predicted membrane chloride channel (bestrophin family)